jgi:hypothetical protein
MRVSFFLAHEPDLAALAAVDPDRDVAQFQRGERIWILQTYLRLARAGFDCALTDRVPGAGLVVFHAKHERELARRLPAGGAPVLVGVRADNRQPLAAEFEIVQSGRWADGRTRHFVPHWPQPGLVARDPARGERLTRIAYKGYLENLHPDFRAPGWSGFLAARGIEWRLEAPAFRAGPAESGGFGWEDYRAVDAVLAVRPPGRRRDASKPASKLVNAWLAGVPALLGPEPAFRELRRAALDYLEVASRADAERAVARLQEEPGLYAGMVAHGRERAREQDAAAVLARWLELLGRVLPALAAEPGRSARRHWPLGLRRAGRWAARTLAARPPR